MPLSNIELGTPTLEDGETGDNWRQEALEQIKPFIHWLQIEKGRLKMPFSTYKSIGAVAKEFQIK